MFRQNTYGGYNSSTYGNASYYPPQPDESCWGSKQNNRVNYRQQEVDSLYSYSEDGSDHHLESGLAGLSINQSKNNSDNFGTPNFAASLGRKTTTWASIASQPAKSQPKSLKSKMAASGLTGLSTSKHLPPTVTMDAWESKNGSLSSVPGSGKSIPPPAVITSPSVPPPPSIGQPPISPIEDNLHPSSSPPPPPSVALPPPPPPPPAMVRPPPSHLPERREAQSWSNNGSCSSSGSVSTSASSPRPPPSIGLAPAPKLNNHKAPVLEEVDNYNPPSRPVIHRNSNYSKPVDSHHQSYSSKNSVYSPREREIANSSPPQPAASSNADSEDSFTGNPVALEKFLAEQNYNPKEFDLNPRNARFFIIKSYSEDDVHRSIKYSIWCSTDHGNKRLDAAFRQQENKGPIYLFYSVNRSGHFCGIAQMMSPVDYNASSGVWAQDKWKGQFQVKWIYVKDVPNDELRHITLENNENKPVTNSRDTQEVPYEKGKKVLTIIHRYEHRTSIFDDFLHYEKKQEEELKERKPDVPSPPPQAMNRAGNPHYAPSSGMPVRDGPMSYRSGPGNGNFPPKHRSYPEGREPHRGEYRNEYRADYRPERVDYRNDRAGEFGRDPRHMEHRIEYRDNHNMRDGRFEYNREYGREYRDQYHRNEPQYHREFHQMQPRDQYPHERNDYRVPERDPREFRERNLQHERHQSWRN